MKVGDVVELSLLDHADHDKVNLDSSSDQRTPLPAKAWGKVKYIGKLNGHGFVELMHWQQAGENNTTQTILLDVVLKTKVMK